MPILDFNRSYKGRDDKMKPYFVAWDRKKEEEERWMQRQGS